jgi:hypothetical protein
MLWLPYTSLRVVISDLQLTYHSYSNFINGNRRPVPGGPADSKNTEYCKPCSPWRSVPSLCGAPCWWHIDELGRTGSRRSCSQVWRIARWTVEPHKGEAARGNDWFVNWSDFPSVVPIDESFWVAHWLINKEGENVYHYDIAISVSRDAGMTWSAPRPPYRSATQRNMVLPQYSPCMTVPG